MHSQICKTIYHWSNIALEKICLGWACFTTVARIAWHCWNIWYELSAQLCRSGRDNETQRHGTRIFFLFFLNPRNVKVNNWMLSFILLFSAFWSLRCSVLSRGWWKCNEVWRNSASFSRNACGSAFQPNTNNAADGRRRWKLTEELKSFFKTETPLPVRHIISSTKGCMCSLWGSINKIWRYHIIDSSAKLQETRGGLLGGLRGRRVCVRDGV